MRLCPAVERRAPESPASIGARAVSDVAAREDLLGFEPYVSAMARFLEETKPPLTVSIEGKWGSGKSTFMDLLDARLQRGATRGMPIVVRFNPWRHEEQDALWAAFAKEFVATVKREAGWRRRLAGDLRLRAYQHRARLYAASALAISAPALGWAAFTFAPRWPLLAQALPGDLGTAAAAGTLTLGGAVAAAASALRDPIERAIARGEKDATTAGALMDRLRADMDRILRLYADDRPVYVLVDDLDRSTRAADMMRAVAQLMADQNRVVFLLAMDREKVAASLAHHQSDVLPYLDPGRDPASVGLEYGHQYVEKFIQLPFRVPQPAVRDVERYFESLATPPEKKPREEPVPWVGKVILAVVGLFSRKPSSGSGARRVRVEGSEDARAPFVVGKDSPETREVFLAVAPALDHNPRRLKQFLNLFRFRTFVAAETGLFEPADGRPPLTLRQLGKFVALTIQWPALVDRLDDEPDLLRALETQARSGVIPSPWLRDHRLVQLLRLGGDDPSWSLADVPLAAFLATAPRVRTLAEDQGGLLVVARPREMSLAPGEEREVAFEVTNLSADARMVGVWPEGGNPGWSLRYSVEPFVLAPGETATASILVRAADRAKEGDRVQVEVTFHSQQGAARSAVVVDVVSPLPFARQSGAVQKQA